MHTELAADYQSYFESLINEIQPYEYGEILDDAPRYWLERCGLTEKSFEATTEKKSVEYPNNITYNYSIDSRSKSLRGALDRKGPKQDRGDYLEQDRTDAGFQEEISAVFRGLPDDPNSRLAALTTLNEAFRVEFAKQMQHSLNILFHSKPSDTYEDKKELVRFANEKLRTLGLTIQYALDGNDQDQIERGEIASARLFTERSNPNDNVGRFRLACKHVDDKESKILLGRELPILEFRIAPPRREALSFQERVGRKDSRIYPTK